MVFIYVVVLIVVICFGGVLLFGAPYVPSLKPQIKTALELLDLKPGQSLLEVGCGDGKVLLAAAEQGILVYGYEINPILVLICLYRTRKQRNLVKVIWGDALTAKLPQTDGIYVFGLEKVVKKLHKKVIHNYDKPTKLVSVGFEIKSIKYAKKDNGVFLYRLQHK